MPNNTSIINEYLEQETLIAQSSYFDPEDLSSLLNPNDTNYLKIFNNNARSLLSNQSQYQMYFADLAESHKMAFDILTFTETWLNDHLSNIVHFDSYTGLYKNKFPVKEGGGIAIFVKNGMNYKVRSDLCFPPDKCHMFDCLFIEVKPNKLPQSRPVVLGVLYRSPSFNSISEFDGCLSDIVHTLKRENKDIILMGDLNVNLLSTDKNNNVSAFLDSMISKGLFPKITVPTRISNTSATLIDHIYTNMNFEQTIAGTLKTDISDHFSNFIFTHSNPGSKNKIKYTSFRNLSENSLAKFEAALSQTDWSNVLSHDDPEVAYSIFIQMFNNLMNIHLPFKMVRINKFKHKMSPWITNGLLVSLRTKSKLYKNMHNINDQQRLYEAKCHYKSYCNLYKKTIRAAKKLFWHNQFDNTKNDMKATWKNINYLLGRNKSKSSFPDYFNHENTIINSPEQIAENFNLFYVNIGPKLADKIPSSQKTITDYLPDINIPNSFFFTPCSPIEILNIINKLKPKCSAGHDDISPKLIKRCAIPIAEPLTHIINKSLQSGTIPSDMKRAKILPFYKNEDPHLFKNYRPISLLPTFSKVLERAVYNRLYKYLKTHNLISPSQFGFQQNLSTEMAILEFQDRLTKHIVDNKLGLGVFLDLSKAFDTLNHDILIKKLEHLGVRGTPLIWFRNYLSNRSQFIQLNGSASTCKTILSGVPQGSILGPLLFLTYINDLPHNCDSDTILFADDTNILFYNENLNNLQQQVNHQLKKVSEWFNTNKLSLNTKKSKYILFYKQRQRPPEPNIKIHIDQNEIDRTNNIKFLGVTIDSTLSWQSHLKQKNIQILKVNGILSQLQNIVEKRTLHTIYNSLIYPHISYAISVWGNISNTEYKRMYILQKKAIRLISNAKYNSHTSKLFKKLNLLKLPDIYTLSCSSLFYNANSTKSFPYLLAQLPTNTSIHDHNTRYADNIHTFNVTTELSKQLLNYKISTVWNSIPHNLRNSQYKSSFSSNIKKWLTLSYDEECTVESCYICNRDLSYQ